MIDKNDQLNQVSEKIDEIKSRNKKNDNKQKQLRGRQISIAMRISIELIISIIIGATLGWYIDKWFDTKPIFFIIFLILGIMSGIKTAITSSRQLYEDNNNDH